MYINSYIQCHHIALWVVGARHASHLHPLHNNSLNDKSRDIYKHVLWIKYNHCVFLQRSRQTLIFASPQSIMPNRNCSKQTASRECRPSFHSSQVSKAFADIHLIKERKKRKNSHPLFRRVSFRNASESYSVPRKSLATSKAPAVQSREALAQAPRRRT